MVRTFLGMMQNNYVTSVTRIFSESSLYRFEINALEKDPVNGDQDG